jgi:outer membrane protein assembly factor BamB
VTPARITPARGVAVLWLLWVPVACRAPVGPADAGLPVVVVSRLDSVALTWTPEDKTLRAWSPKGAALWAFTLPDGDSLVAAPCVAPDSSVYARGRDTLYAVSATGTLVWSRKVVNEQPAPLSTQAPAALTNSGVVYASDPRTLVALTPDGVEMWRHVIGVNDVLRSSPVTAPNGLITVVTTSAVLQVASDGLLQWRGAPGLLPPAGP